MPQSEGVRVHEFSHQIHDGGNVCEVMKGFNWGSFENLCDLTYALILGDLHMGEEALLVDACVPYLDTIAQHRDYKRIVNTTPVHEVETPDRVPKDTYPADGGVCAVYYDADMLLPFKVGSDEDPEVAE